MNSKFIWGLIAFAVIMVISSIFLIPQKNEIALMEYQDGKFKEAIKTYEQQIAKGDTSINTVMPLAQLYLQYGDVKNGIGMIERFVAAHPDSLDAKRHLASYYQFAEMPYAYQRTMKDITDQHPTEEALHTLADSYEFRNMGKEEIDTLEKLVHMRGYSPKESDYTKLAQLYAVFHNTKQAAQTMADFYQQKGDQMSGNAAELTISLLLDTKRIMEAQKIAASYIHEHKDNESAIAIATEFQERGNSEFAVSLLIPLMRDETNNHELIGEFISASLQSGNDKDVLPYLMKEVDAGVISDTISEALIDYGIRKNDITLLVSLPSRMPLDEVSDALLVEYADFSFHRHLSPLARAIRKNLGEPFLQNAPYLSALLTLAGGDRSSNAIARFVDVTHHINLNTEEKLSAIEVLSSFNQQKPLFALLHSLPDDIMLDNFDAGTIATAYLTAGNGAEAVQHFEAGRSKLPAKKSEIDQLLFFLYAGTGLTDKFTALADSSSTTTTQLDDSISIAELNHQSAIIIIAAERLLAIEPDNGHRLELSEAYEDNHDYAKAVTTIKPAIHDSLEAQLVFIAALQGLINQNNASAAQPYINDLDFLADDALKNSAMSIEDKRDLAYLLVDSHLPAKAASIFFALAQNAPADSDTVHELLDLWGDNLTQENKDWIIKRAKNSSGAESAKWQAYLTHNIDHSSDDASTEQTPAIRNDTFDDELERLAETTDKTKLEAVLSQQLMKAGNNSDHLKKIAAIADDHDLSAVSEKALRRLLAIGPNDLDTKKKLALLLYYRKDFHEAEPLLTSYVTHNDKDFRIDYVYAEMLWRNKKQDQARPYYMKSLSAIAALPHKNRDILTIQAQIWATLGNTDQAINQYRELLKRTPNDKGLKADLAEILIEAKRYKEADAVLK